MPIKFRLATFNCENLFARYRFRANVDPYTLDGFTVNELAFDIYDEADKRITAQAIKEVSADVICLQEVESLPVLDRFKSTYLPREGYDHRIVIDCFDPRHIDVGVLSRYPITGIRTNRHLRSATSSASLFSRDCLEVDLDVKGKPFTVFVNHFKSMMDGRAETRPRREAQVNAVAQILLDRLATNPGLNFAVVGDFNDYLDAPTSLGALVGPNSTLVNVVDRLPQADQWTHYWAGGNEYRQLDYILVPPALAGGLAATVYRKGLPYRATRYAGDRLNDVGDDHPKASDHCPVSVEISL